MDNDRREMDALKYRDLQRLAKEYGLKANMSKDSLIAAILAAKAEAEKSVSSPVKRIADEHANSATKKPRPSGSRFAEFVAEEDKVTVSQETVSITPKVATPKSKPFKLSTPKSIKSKPNTPKPGTPKVTARATPMTVAPKGTPKNPAPNHLSARKSLTISKKSDHLRAHFAGTPSSVAKATPRTLKAASGIKKTVERAVAAAAGPSVSGTGIPRFVTKRRVPNFAKLHAQEFDKMDSLDVYLNKKKERTQNITASAQKPTPAPLKTESKTSSVVKPSFKGFTPSTDSLLKKPMRRSPRNQESVKTAEKKTFVPSSLVVNEKNFSFGANSTFDRSKPFVFTASGPSIKSTAVATTPAEKVLHNITNKETPASGKKQFNLKASLARPLSYVPHKGKLRSWEDELKEKRKALSCKDTVGAGSKKIKGVRLNKRAELLLQRRKIT